MQVSDGRQYFGVGLDLTQLRQGASEARSLLHGIGQQAVSEGQLLDNALKKIGGAVAGVFAVSKLQEFASKLSMIRGEFQQLEIAFGTMLQSESKADALMQQLISTAAVTPFNMSDVANSAKQLLAYGVEADKVNETLIRLGDIAAGLSIPINDLAYLYGTTMVQGRMYTQDLNQFLGRGIPLTEELAKQFGVTKNKVKSLVEEGKVGFPEVEKAIIAMTSEGGKFGGLMEAQSKSITGQMSNIEDAIEQMYNELGKKSEGIISDTLGFVSEAIDHWEEIGKAILVVISAYGAYKAAVIGVAAAHKIASIMGEVRAFISLTKYVHSAKDAMILFNTVCKANPLGLIIGLLASAAAAFALFSKSSSEAAEMTNKYGERAATTLSRLDTLTMTLKGLTEGTSTHKKVMADLNEILEEYGIAAIKEGDSIDVINKKREQAIELIKEEAGAKQWANALAQGDTDYNNAITEAQNQLYKDLQNAKSGSFDSIFANTSANEEIRENAAAISQIIGEAVEQNISLIAGKTGKQYEDGINKIYATIQERLRATGKISEETLSQAWSDGGWFWETDLMGKYIEGVQKATEAHTSYTDAVNASHEAEEKAAQSTMTFDEKVAAISSRIKGADDDVHGLYKRIQNLMSQYSENTIGFKIKFNAEVPAWMNKMDIPELKRLAEYFTSHGAALKNGQKLRVGDKTFTKQEALQHGADYAQAAENKQQETDKKQRELESTEKERKRKAAAAARKAEQEKKAAEREAQQIADQTADRNMQIQEYTKSVAEAVEESELDILQRKLDIREESLEKELEQVKINYKRLNHENLMREKQMIEDLADNKLNQWLNQNPKATKTEQSAYRNSLLDPESATRLTRSDLSAEQRNMLKQYEDIATESLNRGNEQALQSALADVQAYAQKRQKILEDYAKREEALYDHDADGNRTGLRKEVSQGNIDELQRQRDEALSSVDEEFASREEEYQAWCNAIASQTLSQLENTLETAKAKLAELEKSGKASDKELAQARAAVNKAQKSVNTARAKAKVNPGKQAQAEWQDLYKTLNEVRGSFEEIGETVGGVVGDIISECGKMASSTLTMINGIVTLVNSSKAGIEATGKAGAQALSTMEKASVILTIISAAIQIAMQIINLFNDDAEKQEEIEALQERIDQLQWELDNAELMRSRKYAEGASYLEQVQKILYETRVAMVRLGSATNNWSMYIQGAFARVSDSTDLMHASVERLAKAYAHMAYTTDKALGEEKYESATDQLRNIAKQQLLIQEQIDLERSKKGADSSSITEMEHKIEELGQKALEVINDMVEDIIGDSASGIAQELGDAFFEAFGAGEDAAKAWGDKVNDIVGDILKRMMVQKCLEEPLGEIFNKYKDKWFPDGKFAGIDAVMDSMTGFANDLNGQLADFQTVIDALPDELKQYFTSKIEDERSASEGGIATASQESVDELNGRATAIQSHTFSISENTKLLVTNTNAILASVMNIEGHTESMQQTMRGVSTDIKQVRATLDDIQRRGLKLTN